MSQFFSCHLRNWELYLKCNYRLKNQQETACCFRVFFARCFGFPKNGWPKLGPPRWDECLGMPWVLKRGYVVTQPAMKPAMWFLTPWDDQDIFQQMLVAAAICFSCKLEMVLEHGKQLWFQLLESILDCFLAVVWFYFLIFQMDCGWFWMFPNVFSHMHSQRPRYSGWWESWARSFLENGWCGWRKFEKITDLPMFNGHL